MAKYVFRRAFTIALLWDFFSFLVVLLYLGRKSEGRFFQDVRVTDRTNELTSHNVTN